tara:strand:- start:182 stop:793 length:612 start_codon:yes stop_codon:yes gene_type:complete
MKKLLLLFIPLMFFFGCEEDNANGNLSIGDFHEGGVIFYLDSNGGGLVCDIKDLSNPFPANNTYIDQVPWGCQGITLNGANEMSIGAGNQNTNDILVECTQSLNNTTGPAWGGIAAEVCSNSDAQGYTDWFLPSINELKEIHNNLTVINSTALSNGGDEFEIYGYWSSTQNNNNTAFQVIFPLGNSPFVFKESLGRLRAIRSF